MKMWFSRPGNIGTIWFKLVILRFLVISKIDHDKILTQFHKFIILRENFLEFLASSTPRFVNDQHNRSK